MSGKRPNLRPLHAGCGPFIPQHNHPSVGFGVLRTQTLACHRKYLLHPGIPSWLCGGEAMKEVWEGEISEGGVNRCETTVGSEELVHSMTALRKT